MERLRSISAGAFIRIIAFLLALGRVDIYVLNAASGREFLHAVLDRKALRWGNTPKCVRQKLKKATLANKIAKLTTSTWPKRHKLAFDKP